MSDRIICYCANVTEDKIVKAIKAGANSIKAIQDATGAGIGSRCSEVNPTGRCCHIEISELINKYTSEDASPPCCSGGCCG